MSTIPEKIVTGLAGFDYVLGDLPISGSLILVCGREGVGKTTLLMTVARALAKHSSATILYVSTGQTLVSLKRQFEHWPDLFIDSAPPNLRFVYSDNAAGIFEAIDAVHPAIVIVDSLQSIDVVTNKKGAPLIRGGSAAIGRLCTVFKELAVTRTMAVIGASNLTADGRVGGRAAGINVVDTIMVLKYRPGRTRRVLEYVHDPFSQITRIATFEIGCTLLDHGPVRVQRD